jgi:hypothetical protein
VPYVSTPDDEAILRTAFAIYQKQDKVAQALNVAIRLNDRTRMQECVAQCQDKYHFAHLLLTKEKISVTGFVR